MDFLIKLWNKIMYLLKDKAFWLNSILFFIVLIITGWMLLFSLKLITKWGQSADVPNVVNKNVEQAIEMIEDVDLEYEIKDSVYRADLKEGTVLDAQPSAGLNVKTGRTIYLIISSKRPPMVAMPQLAGRSSLRFAQVELESRGLKLGSLTFEPSNEKDAVLSQRIGNTEIAAGTMIPKGTVINLTLGDGLTGVLVDVPNLMGKTKSEVDLILSANGIIANFFYDKNIEDTMSSYVIKQYPLPNNEEKLNLGETIDLFFSKNKPKIIPTDSALRK
jgi:beta-lactam-binding protein with PASTA domain